MISICVGLLILVLLYVVAPVMRNAMMDSEYPNPLLRVGLTVLVFCLLTTIIGSIVGAYIDTGQVNLAPEIDLIIICTCIMSAVLLPITLFAVQCFRLWLH